MIWTRFSESFSPEMKDFQAQLGNKRPEEVFDFNQLDCNQQLS